MGNRTLPGEENEQGSPHFATGYKLMRCDAPVSLGLEEAVFPLYSLIL